MASRSVFMLAQTYLPRRVADIFGRTNNGHTPLSAILLCSMFGFVSLAGLSRQAYDQVNIYSSMVTGFTPKSIHIYLVSTFY